MAASYWLSNEYITVGVKIEEGIIVDIPPVVKKFKGQPLTNLVRWMRNMDPTGFQIAKV